MFITTQWAMASSKLLNNQRVISHSYPLISNIPPPVSEQESLPTSMVREWSRVGPVLVDEESHNHWGFQDFMATGY